MDYTTVNNAESITITRKDTNEQITGEILKVTKYEDNPKQVDTICTKKDGKIYRINFYPERMETHIELQIFDEDYNVLETSIPATYEIGI